MYREFDIPKASDTICVMSPLGISMFYLAVFFASGLLCIPIGPVNIEIFNTALKKHYPQAICIAAGAALGDGVWGLCGLFGITPFTSNPVAEGSFMLGTAIITAVLGIISLKDSRKLVQDNDTPIVVKIRRKRWSLLKGLTMVLVNPLGIVSWMLVLSFLRQQKLLNPPGMNYTIAFFITVTCGALAYFITVIFVTRKMKRIITPERQKKITFYLGYLLIVISGYFIYKAISVFFFDGSVQLPV